MREPSLTKQEIATIKTLRYEDELSFKALGERLGIDWTTAYRILNNPKHRFEEMTLIRIRKGLKRLAEETRQQRVPA